MLFVITISVEQRAESRNSSVEWRLEMSTIFRLIFREFNFQYSAHDDNCW